MKKALITGITGQDGSYLADLLLEKGYEVHGIVRRSNIIWREWLEHLHLNEMYGKSLFLHFADLSDLTSFRKILKKAQPNELYHLAGQSHVGLSFEMPEITSYETGFSVLSLLEIIRDLNSPIRFFHATSSEIFGAPDEIPQRESTPFRPVSPYGAAKVFASNIVRIYREVHGLFLVNGIMYNHESPRRGETFVTRKITRALSRIKLGLQNTLFLGNLDAKRDWGHAKDYVEMQWLMLQQNKPEDFVIATGVQHSVRDFIEAATKELGMDIVWRGQGVNEIGQWNGREIIKVDRRYFRPTEVETLLGDSTKARIKLGWRPKISFQELISEMVREDFKAAKCTRF